MLRLANASAKSPAEVRTLKQTAKALALARIEGHQAVAEAAEDPAVTRARSLVEGFRAIEVDNAARADQGAAQWLPLLHSESDFLRDARMFLLPPPDADAESEHEAAAGGGESEKEFKIVLLLDLTRLGQVRVDLSTTDAKVSATFQVSNPGALAKLHASTDELRSMLEGDALEVLFLRVRSAPGGEVPVGDLLRPARGAADGLTDALVDVHA